MGQRLHPVHGIGELISEAFNGMSLTISDLRSFEIIKSFEMTDLCPFRQNPGVRSRGRTQICPMPWGVLSLNVNSGKTWWYAVLLSIASDRPCYNVLYDRGFFWRNDLNPMKIGKNPLGSWMQDSAGSPGSWAFFSKFWFGEGRNWIGCENGI